MTAKTSPARRAAFLAAVAATGNQGLVAERARVSRSWVTLHRMTDPAFRAELDAALATARERITAQRSAGMRPERGWQSQSGEELVARGGNGRRTQIARARLRQWTPRVEARFLQALAGCCNVKAACGAVGLSQVAAYNHRQRWPSFAERWDAALAAGYARIEAAMVAAAGAMFAAGESAGDPADGTPYAGTPDLVISEMRVDAALQLLWLHQAQVRGTGNRPGAAPRPPDTAAHRASIMASLAQFERYLARGAVDAQADRRAIAHGVAVVRRAGTKEVE
jgi:hypothetical protein